MELLLDVVYVYVLTRLTAVLADDLSWRGAYRELLLFLAVWWIWYRIITDPLDHIGVGDMLVILGGPALFLLGRGLLDYATFSHVSWSRPAGVIALAALAPLGSRQPSVVTAGLAAVVLGGVSISNVLAWRLFPRTIDPPMRPHTLSRK